MITVGTNIPAVFLKLKRRDLDMENKRIIYGLKEIADAIGVPRKTLGQWHFRQKNNIKTPVEQLPPPTDVTSTSPVWLAEVIEPWIEKEQLRQKKKTDDRGEDCDK